MDISTTATFKFAENMLPRLVKALVKLSKSRKNELEKITDVFGDPLKWAEYYIEPYCQQFNPADESDESRFVVREHLTSRLQHFLGGSEKTNTPHQIILADSGMGKTSCLVMLKLAHLNSFWPQPYSVYLLKLGHDTLDIVRTLEKRKSVLLLDALDEDPLAWGRITDRLGEILNATKHFTRVVITCRTQFFSAGEDPFNRRGHAEVGGFLCPVVYLSLFDDLQVSEYLQKRFPRDTSIFNRAMPIITKMKALKFRPMLLSHIEELLDSTNTDWTTHSVYQALVSAWLHRERAKMLAQRKPEDVPTLSELMRACLVLSRLMFQLNSISVSIEAIGNAVGFDSVLCHIEEIDIAGRSLLNKNSEGNYRFAHFSIQEYLFSQVIAQGIVPNYRKREYKPTAQVFFFLDYHIRRLQDNERKKLVMDYLSLSGLRLEGLDWNSLNLNEQIFKKTEFIKCSLASALLVGSEFIGAQLDSTQLTSAALDESIITDTSAKSCDFANATITRSKIDNSTFYKVSFRLASLAATTVNSSRFKECNFSDCQLSKVKFDEVEFEDCIFDDTAFVDAAINDCTFTNCDLSRVRFTLELFESKFPRCKLPPREQLIEFEEQLRIKNLENQEKLNKKIKAIKSIKATSKKT